MAIVVEDGTGLPNANSFASVAYADDYFSTRAIAGWAGTNPEKEAWLIRATDYIESRFGAEFAGERKTEDQALSFPRVCAEFAEMPATLLKATAEYALRAKSGPLAPDPTVDSSGFAVASRRKKVGPIETEISFATGAGMSTGGSYPAADALLASLLSGVFGLRTVRA